LAAANSVISACSFLRAQAERRRQSGEFRVKHIYLIGIGTGNPEHLTIQAINAMNAADVIFIPTKGKKKEELAEVRRDICERYLRRAGSRIVEFAVPQRTTANRTYAGSVDQWHAAIAETYHQLIDDMAEQETAAFLVWGDPSLYDSTIRIIERVKKAGAADFDFSVIPGITSVQALAASHRIAINLVGKAVEITTGRRLLTDRGNAESTVVMLDGEQAFSKLDEPDTEIFWAAYLGTKDEIIRSGRLGEVGDDILKARAEARERHGWIMDIYLLRKGRDFEGL
jgi:precorrin-6A synthase